MRSLFIFLLTTTLTFSLFSAQPEINLVFADIESYPIQMGFGREISDPPGLAVELIQKAAKELNIEVNITRIPNKRILKELEIGRVDGAFCFSYKKAREDAAIYPFMEDGLDSSRRITSISYYLYTLDNSPLKWDGVTFINLKGALGGNSGYSIVKDLRDKGIEIEEAISIDQNLKKLKSGRITGFAGQDITTDQYLIKTEYANIKKHPIPLATKDYFLIFSHQFVTNNPILSEKLWDKIGELRDRVLKEEAYKYID